MKRVRHLHSRPPIHSILRVRTRAGQRGLHATPNQRETVTNHRIRDKAVRNPGQLFDMCGKGSNFAPCKKKHFTTMAIKIKALERFASSIREQAQALKTWPFGVLAPPIAPEDAVAPQRPKKGRHNPGWGVSPIKSGSHQITKPRRGGMVSYQGVAYGKTLVARMVSNGTDLNCIFPPCGIMRPGETTGPIVTWRLQ